MPERDFRREFNNAIRAQLQAIERTLQIFNAHADHLDTQLADLRENDAELKRLILEQGAEIRALRERLDGR